MKNLKKVLALVLVVATLMGLATVAGATFTDASSIEYKEAVDVLSAINVINGYTDGSFRPTGNVTRAQMAKMVAYIVAGGEDVGNLYAGANTFSDCTTHWAKGYIAYANKTGIVAGVGNGKFNPEGSVTGTQAAKMMLCALGYDAGIEEYTGTNWAVNVLSDAKEVGLLKGLEKIDMSKAMTREQAAQLMLNALKADMVKYENKGSEVDLGNGVVIRPSGSTAEAVTTIQAWGANISNDGIDDADKVSANNPYVVQLGEKYFEDLKLLPGESDDLGRPASVWEYDGKEVAASASDAAFVYTSEIKSADLEKDLKNYTVNVTDKNFITNGDAEGDTGNTSSTITSVANIAAQTGNGIRVELYTTNKKITSVVVIKTTLTTVSTNITTSGKESVTVSGCTKVTLEDNEKLYNELKSYKADDDILVIKNKNNDILEVVGAPEAVSGTYTRLSGGKYTIGGTAYEAAKGTDMSAVAKLGNTYDLLLDQYGYVVKAEASSSESDDYAFLADTEVEGNKISGETYMAQLIFADGTKAWVAVDELNGDEVEEIATIAAKENNFVSYVKNSDNTYDLSTKNLTTTPYAPTDKGTTGSADNGDVAYSITKGKVQFLTKHEYNTSWSSSSEAAKGSSKTVFVYNVDDKLTAYTGIANAPSTTAEDLGTTVYTLSKDSVIEMVYVVTDELSGSSASDLVYITDKTADAVYVDADTDSYYEFEAIVDGEVTTVKAAADDTFNAVGLFNVTKYDSNGYIKTAEKVDTTKDEFVVPTTQTKIAIKDGVITVDTDNYYVLAEKYTIYVIDSDGGVVTMAADDVKSLDDIKGITMVGNLDKDDQIVDIAEIYLIVK